MLNVRSLTVQMSPTKLNRTIELRHMYLYNDDLAKRIIYKVMKYKIYYFFF